MITPTPEFWKVFKETPGALSCAEALALYNICLDAPRGCWMELGTHKGKSTSVIVFAAKEETTLILVEPEFSDPKWEKNVMDTVLSVNESKITIGCVADYSTNILPKHTFDISLLFVDSGDHGEEIVQEEKNLYQDKIAKGGIIVFHDYNSQFTAVTRCYDELVANGRYEPILINWDEIFQYAKENNLEEGNNSWHLYPELPHPPNFVGALKRK